MWSFFTRIFNPAAPDQGPDLKARVQEWYRQRRDTPGFREVAIQTPDSENVSLEVSTWVQIPYLFQKISEGGLHTIKFPPLSDPVATQEQMAVHMFLTQHGTTSLSALMPSLEERIFESRSFANLELRLSGAVKTAKEWIAAHAIVDPDCSLNVRYPRKCTERQRDRAATSSPLEQLLVPSRGVAAREEMDAVLCMERTIPTKQISLADLRKMEVLGEGGEGIVLGGPDGTAYKLYTRKRNSAHSATGAAAGSQLSSAGPEGDSSPFLLYLAGQDAARESPVPLVPLPADMSQELRSKLSKLPIWLYEHLALPMSFLTFAERPNEVAGFEMPLVAGAIPLSKLKDPGEKKRLNYSVGTVASHFLSLYDLLWDLEQAEAVAGDLKFDNILVLPDGSLSLIDTDSLGVAEHPCRAFSEGYVDPTLCDRSLDQEKLIRPPDTNAMWYSYAVMLFEALVGAHPFTSGSHQPASGAPEVPDEARALKGISVFHPEVKLYKKFQDALQSLPKDLQQAFREIFAEGKRGRPQRRLISQLVPESYGAKHQYSPHLRSPWSLASSATRAIPKRRGKIERMEQEADPVISARMINGKPGGLRLSTYSSFKTQIAGKLGAAASVGDVISGGQGAVVLEGSFSAEHGVAKPKEEGWAWVLEKGGQWAGIPLSKSKNDVPNIAVLDSGIVFVSPKGEVCSGIGPSHRELGRISGDCWLFGSETFGLLFSSNQGVITDTFLVSDKLQRIVGLPPIIGEVLRIDVAFSRENAWVFIQAVPESAAVGYTLVLDRRGRLRALNAEVLHEQKPWFGESRFCAYDIGPDCVPGLAAISLPSSVQRFRCDGFKIVGVSESPLPNEGAPGILLANEKKLYGIW